MLRRLLSRLRSWTERDEDSGFVRSRLDASVLYAHGQGSVESQAEIETVSEEGERLADVAERERRG
jgi:hypothetical protein